MLTLTYSPKQQEILFQSTAKFVIGAKGRRAGITRGLIQAVVEWLAAGITPILWVDTTYGNIDKYVHEYLNPILWKIPHHLWRWHGTNRTLTLNPGGADERVCHFRSAEIPENIEGLGYRHIIINEPGIVMADTKLFNQSILPMMIDHADSRLFAIGTPKGKLARDGSEHPFYTLWQRAEKETAKYQRYTLTAWDNPFISKDLIDEIFDLIPSSLYRQEIYGEFTNVNEKLWAYAYDPKRHDDSKNEGKIGREILLSFDFNVANMACIAAVFEPSFMRPQRLHILRDFRVRDGSIYEVCSQINAAFPDAHFFITGDASGANRNAVTKDKRSFYHSIAESFTYKSLAYPKSNPSLPNSYIETNSFFERNLITINRDACRNLVADLLSCQSKNDFTIDKSNAERSHWLDALRYLIHTYGVRVERYVKAEKFARVQKNM